ncbi:MAG: ABC transporter ATP-binding protein [Bacteroidota bacterium]
MNILETSQLSKSFDGGKTYAVREVDFRLPSGRVCAIVGESGCGKTTLMRLIAGLERPDGGEIRLHGQVASSPRQMLPCQERNLGMVFQGFALFPHLTVAQNIAYGLDKRQAKQKVEQLLEVIQLTGYNDRYPHELSGGEQQRVALARTLSLDPQLLLLDEPFGSLDAHLRTELRQEVLRIVRQLKLSLLFITHDIQDAIDIADDLVFMKEGRIIEQGELRELFQNPQSPYVRETFQQLAGMSRKILDLFGQDFLHQQ